MQLVSANSQPLIELMTNFLEFLLQTWITNQNRAQIRKFIGKKSETFLENKVLNWGPEFALSVMFQHLFFQESIV